LTSSSVVSRRSWTCAKTLGWSGAPELFCDATKVAANADLDSLVPRFYHEAKIQVGDLFTNDPVPIDGRKRDGADPLPSDGLLRLPPCGGKPRH
jgi:hypothetical protein